jgi:hypothetical protein
MTVVSASGMQCLQLHAAELQRSSHLLCRQQRSGHFSQVLLRFAACGKAMQSLRDLSQTTMPQFLERKAAGRGSGALYVVGDDGTVIVNSDSETVPATPNSTVLSPASRHLPATYHRVLTEVLRLQLRMPLRSPDFRLLLSSFEKKA